MRLITYVSALVRACVSVCMHTFTYLQVIHELCGLAKSDETYIKADLGELGVQVSAEESEELTVGIDLWMDWLAKQYVESR